MTPERHIGDLPIPPLQRFPDPRGAPGDLPLAVGGDLRPETLLEAYAHGIFPWPDDTEVYWWSPDPRAVIPLQAVHVSRSLSRTLRSGRFRCSIDRNFDAVVAGCADRPGQGTWITPALFHAFRRLHALGVAHSVEVLDRSGHLVGGLYGLGLGAAFMGESMFHRVSDASKVALVHLTSQLHAAGFVLFDAQLPTAHLQRMGARTISRTEYLQRLDRALEAHPEFPRHPPQPPLAPPGGR